MMDASHTGMAHPLVIAYLQDLDAALASADPRERAETLAAVGDHIRDALARHDDANSGAVRSVLAQLGPVEAIAAASSSAPPAREVQHHRTPAALLVASIVALVLVIPVPWAAAAIALGVFVPSLLLLRRASTRSPIVWVSFSLSALCLLAVALMAMTLLVASRGALVATPVPGVPIGA